MNLADVIDLVTVKVRRQGVAVTAGPVERICTILADALPNMKAGDLGRLMADGLDPKVSIVRTWNRIDRAGFQEAKGVHVTLAGRVASLFVSELAHLPAFDLAAIICAQADEPIEDELPDIPLEDPETDQQSPEELNPTEHYEPPRVDPEDIPSPNAKPDKKKGQKKT